MKSFHLLEAATPGQYEKWMKIWADWPQREVFAHPEYVNLFARECDCAICAIQESSDGLIILPMILRPLSAEVWAEEGNEHYDLVAPYGFGGPYVAGRYDMEDFWRNFQDWAIKTGVISAFFRFSPFAADIRELIDSVETNGGNVIRSLTEGCEGIWMDYKHPVRTCVRCAEQNGVTVEFDETGKSIAAFIKIYYRTMKRLHATQRYYFPEEFFCKIVKNLSGQFFLSNAMYQGKVIACKLVLSSQNHIYPFLGGADESFFNLNPNQLLDTHIFYWGVEHEKKTCVLGGGYDGYDGVFQYKKKFAPAGVVHYLVGKHIFDRVAYQKMCEKRKLHELARGQSWTDDGTFFPAYRSKND